LLLLLPLLLLSGGRGPELRGAAKPGLGFGLELGMVAISVDRLELSDGMGLNRRNFQWHRSNVREVPLRKLPILRLDNLSNGSMRLKCLTAPNEG